MWNNYDNNLNNMKKEQRYCCEKCGSSDIEVRAWVKPYENNRFSTYYETSLAETESAYCCNCGEWVKLVEKEARNTPAKSRRAS